MISNTGQNLRGPLATAGAATVEDIDLTNPVVPPATRTVPALGVTAAGYTNNDLVPATATTLFDLDTVPVGARVPALAGDWSAARSSINGHVLDLGEFDADVTDLAIKLDQ